RLTRLSSLSPYPTLFRPGEERAGRPGVVVAGVEDHPLAAPQREDRLADLRRWDAGVDRHVKTTGQLRVAHRRRQARQPHLERDLEDDVPAGRLPGPPSAVVRFGAGPREHGSPVPQAELADAEH